MKDHAEREREELKPPPGIGLGRIAKAFGYSLQGIAGAWRSEGAFRQEVLAAAVLVPVACLVQVAPVERVLLIGSVLLVMAIELLNSSIEAAIDRISLERHALSKRAKDTGSAAVMVAIVIALVTWGVLLGPRVALAVFSP